MTKAFYEELAAYLEVPMLPPHGCKRLTRWLFVRFIAAGWDYWWTVRRFHRMCDRLLTESHDEREIVKGLALAWAKGVEVCGCNGHGSGGCRCPGLHEWMAETLRGIGVGSEGRAAVDRWLSSGYDGPFDGPFDVILETVIDYLLDANWRGPSAALPKI